MADQLAQAQGAEGVGEDLGVAVGAVVDEQHQRLGPLAVVGTQHRALAAVALAEEGVLLGAEVVEHLVVREAAAVVAHVEHDRFLVEVVGIEGPHELVQAGFVHARDVDVAELALAQLGHALGVLFHPALVHQAGGLGAADRLHLDPAAGFRVAPGSSVTWSSTVSPTLSLSSLLSVGAVGELLAVDATDDVARLEVEAALVGRAALEDFGDLQAGAGVLSSKSRPRSAVISSATCGQAADAQVRGVQLAQHQADEGVEVFLDGDVLDQRPILVRTAFQSAPWNFGS